MQRLVLTLAGSLPHIGLTTALLIAAASTSLAQNRAGTSQPSSADAVLRLRQQLVNRTSSSQPLRNSLANLSKAQHITILLDRRIDPEQTIELTAERMSLESLLERIAEKIDAGVSWLGPLAYLGPRDAAARLRTLAAMRTAEIQALPSARRAVFRRAAAWHWETLAEPRGLVVELAEEANVAVESLNRIGHDLWPAADLPPLAWSDRLTLIANEFDLRFEIVDFEHVRLIPIVGPVAIERTYPGGKRPDELAAKWREQAPEAQIEVVRGKIVVRGRAEDHELLTESKKPKPAAVTMGADVYTLRVEDKPLSAVLDTLRVQLSLDLIVDEMALKKANLSLDTKVTFLVENAKLDELLAAVLTPAGLAFHRDGKAYRIVPASP